MRVLSSPLFRDVVQLMSGTVIGRLILLAAMPIITRLYGPDDFALLAVFMAFTSTISVIACLRLELAIPLAQDDDDAANLLAVAVVFSLATSALVLLAAFFLPPSAYAAIGNPELAAYAPLVALGVLTISTYAAFQYWATRARRFRSISRTRIGQSSFGVATMLSLGWGAAGPLGLLLGNVISTGAGGLSLAAHALRHDCAKFRKVSRRRITEVLRTHHRFPVYSTPEALANVGSVQLPILLIAANTSDDAGQLYLAMQIMAAPMTLLGTSVAQVYASRAREELDAGRLSPFTRRIMRRLLLIGIIPIVLVAVIAPLVSPLVFGEAWHRAGVVIALIAPWTLLQFVVTPVAISLHVTNNHWVAMVLQVFGLCLRAGMVFWLGPLPTVGYVEAYAGSGAIFYLVYATTVLLMVRSR